MVPTAGPRSFCTAFGSVWVPVYQAGVAYGSKRHLVAVSYTAKELFCVLNISCVWSVKNFPRITTSHIGRNSRGCQNTVHLFQPLAFSGGFRA